MKKPNHALDADWMQPGLFPGRDRVEKGNGREEIRMGED
jgi:hypothetical protein